MLEEYLETVLKKRPDYAGYYAALNDLDLIDAWRATISHLRHPPSRAGLGRRLVEALDELRPAAVLIEGPADASALLPMLADPAMRPPVALLCYAEDDPARAELLAVRRVLAGVSGGAAGRCATARRCASSTCRRPSATCAAARAGRATAPRTQPEARTWPTTSHGAAQMRDPIGALAAAAGYEDGESWWSDVIEQNPAPGPVFAAIADAMTALREDETRLPALRGRARGAYAPWRSPRPRRSSTAPIAVVCGAWHVPALQRSGRPGSRSRAAQGRAEARRSPRPGRRGPRRGWRFAAAMAPASPRPAGASICGRCAAAAIAATRLAGADRRRAARRGPPGLDRLADRGASGWRGRWPRSASGPHAGFEELRDAAIAASATASAGLWRLIEAELLIGNDVGEIPPTCRWRRCSRICSAAAEGARLKPEALERELSRRPAQRERPRPLDPAAPAERCSACRGASSPMPAAAAAPSASAGCSRWEPEFAVRLVENLVYGPTIARPPAAALIQAMSQAGELDALAELVQGAITADLPRGRRRRHRRARAAGGAQQRLPEMLAALPPLADIAALRRGARGPMPTQLDAPADRVIVVQAALALPYAARDLDAEAAGALVARRPRRRRRHPAGRARGRRAREPGADALRRAARRCAGDAAGRRLRGAPALRGGAARAEDAAALLGARLSPGRRSPDAAGFFEGFFEGAGQRLIHDDGAARRGRCLAADARRARPSSRICRCCGASSPISTAWSAGG